MNTFNDDLTARERSALITYGVTIADIHTLWITGRPAVDILADAMFRMIQAEDTSLYDPARSRRESHLARYLTNYVRRHLPTDLRLERQDNTTPVNVNPATR